MSSSSLSRRALLSAFAATPLVTTGIGAFPSLARAQAAEAGLITPNVCLIAPETVSAPPPPGLMRRDIREDCAGALMTVALQVVQSDCTPVARARVDLWHCDALGRYSGTGAEAAQDAAPEATFLRGSQVTDSTGVATFHTIYPGWYRGRTPHMHYAVHLPDDRTLASQVFLPDALSAYLYRYVDPYSGRAEAQDTTNRTDGIAQRSSEGAFAQVRETVSGYHAALVVGLRA